MRTVELHPAHTWDCDDCGAENFVRCVVPEMSEEDLAELRDDHGVQPWETGQFMTMPNEVTCAKCGATFTTAHMEQDEDGDT
jgi:transcription elongation factor Elf1